MYSNTKHIRVTDLHGKTMNRLCWKVPWTKRALHRTIYTIWQENNEKEKTKTCKQCTYMYVTASRRVHRQRMNMIISRTCTCSCTSTSKTSHITFFKRYEYNHNTCTMFMVKTVRRKLAQNVKKNNRILFIYDHDTMRKKNIHSILNLKSRSLNSSLVSCWRV